MHSHELRSPLASILGLIPLLNLDNPIDPGNVVILDGIKTSAHELDEIIREMDQKTTIADPGN